VAANATRLPANRRAHTRGADRRPILEMAMAAIDLSEAIFKSGIFPAQGSLRDIGHSRCRLAAIAKPTLSTYMLSQHATSS
jgi:hypothetical protein